MSRFLDRRVLVIGTSSAGKTTFSARLGKAMNVPVVELDELYWGENWTPRPQDEFFRRVDEATSDRAWVSDGNYSAVRNLLWPKATTVIWLNYSKALLLWRGLKRTLRRRLRREVLWQGNRESLRMTFFSKDSILLWIYTTFDRRRHQIEALRQSAEYSHLEWIEFQHPTEAERWLRLAEENVMKGVSELDALHLNTIFGSESRE